MLASRNSSHIPMMTRNNCNVSISVIWHFSPVGSVVRWTCATGTHRPSFAMYLLGKEEGKKSPSQRTYQRARTAYHVAALKAMLSCDTCTTFDGERQQKSRRRVGRRGLLRL